MKKKIALVTGGFTSEAVVSLKTADTIEQNLDKLKYEVYKIVVSKNSWYYTSGDGADYPVNKHDFTIDLLGSVIHFDGIFIALHGSPGEDGKLQGYFDMLGLPYCSCGAITSAITMNKAYTKAIVADIDGLRLARSMQLFDKSQESIQRVRNKLVLPLFVKSNHGGSSINMSKITKVEMLSKAILRAFEDDSEVLVEEFIEGREFSIGVYKEGDSLVVLPSTEVVPSGDFFDFQSKYTAGMAEEITPGRMNDEETTRVNQIVGEIYRRLNCKGVVRIDYFLEKKTSDFYFIEINTIPGQTEFSFIPQQVRASGQTMTEFYDKLLSTIL